MLSPDDINTYNKSRINNKFIQFITSDHKILLIDLLLGCNKYSYLYQNVCDLLVCDKSICDTLSKLCFSRCVFDWSNVMKYDPKRKQYIEYVRGMRELVKNDMNNMLPNLKHLSFCSDFMQPLDNYNELFGVNAFPR